MLVWSPQGNLASDLLPHTLTMWYKQKSAIDPAAIRGQLSRLLNITVADTPTSEFQETGASGAVHKVTLRDGKNRPHRVILKLVSNASPYLLYKEILEPLDLDSPMMFGCIDTGKGLYLVMEYIPHEPLDCTTRNKYKRAINWLVKKDTLIQDSAPRLQHSQYLQRFAARSAYRRVEYCVETITRAIKSLLTPSLSGKLVDTLTYYQADLHRLQTRLAQTYRLTLSHYDFQMANILFGIEGKKGQTYIIDWSNPCIDSVCIDLVTLLSNAPNAIRQSLLEMYRTHVDFPNFDEIYHGAEILANIGLLAWTVDLVLDGQTNMVHHSHLERQAERVQRDLSGLDQILA